VGFSRVHIDTLLERVVRNAELPAIVGDGVDWNYARLHQAVSDWDAKLLALDVGAGELVAIRSDFRAEAIACLLALFKRGCIAVMVSPNDPSASSKCVDIGARLCVRVERDELIDIQVLTNTPIVEPQAPHPLVQTLLDRSHPGFVVFSSGSSGSPKAVLHDADGFCAHLVDVQKAKSTIGFLALDHIAGVDTLLYTLFAGGRLVLLSQRTPAGVCSAIETYRAEVLPASPSFLKLLVLDNSWQRYDLASLQIITFGSEPPDTAVNKAIAEALPQVQLMQKYGASEFGAPRSKTRPDDTGWLKLDGPHFKTKVIDDVLWVKTSGTMLGYLNHELPASDDGWLCTGDRVETDGEWLRILGRESDIINVGGEKVFPAEVERQIEQMPEVLECAVSSEPHVLLGHVVVAKLRLVPGAELAQPKLQVRRHCASRLPKYALPVRVELTQTSLTSQRGKRLRD